MHNIFRGNGKYCRDRFVTRCQKTDSDNNMLSTNTCVSHILQRFFFVCAYCTEKRQINFYTKNIYQKSRLFTMTVVDIYNYTLFLYVTWVAKNGPIESV